MNKKLLVTISRQAGIGMAVSEELSNLLGIPLHTNKTMAEQYADADEYYAEAGETIPSDSHYGKALFSLGSNTINKDTYEAQRKAILNIASEGDAIITGRCADYILEGYSGLVKVFISADMSTKILQMKKDMGVNEEEAQRLIRIMDKSRQTYYKHFTKRQWGSRDLYDICIDMSGMTPKETAELIKLYIDSLS